MRGSYIIMGLAAALASCSDPVGDAKRELEIVERAGGNLDEICAAKRKLASANLSAHKERDYQISKIDANSACLSAQMGVKF